MTTTRPSSTTARIWPLAADLVCVMALAAGGRSSHEADEPVSIVLAIGWPFAVAATLAHLGLGLRGRPTARSWPEGALVVAATYALGMVLRAVSGRGLAPGFLVVAALFLAVTMLGWRLVVALRQRRRSPQGGDS